MIIPWTRDITLKVSRLHSTVKTVFRCCAEWIRWLFIAGRSQSDWRKINVKEKGLSVILAASGARTVCKRGAVRGSERPIHAARAEGENKMSIVQRIKDWWRPQSIYVVVAWGDHSQEVIPVSSWKKAVTVRDVLRRSYGGHNVMLASRRIDDVPYLVRRRMLVDQMSIGTAPNAGKEGNDVGFG